nr:RelA/SpoT domain-containing protein [uncultured Draconibacterium sp.]
MNNKLVEEFKTNRKLYEAFCKRVENLIRELIMGLDIKPFSIESRTKSLESFEGKIRNKDKYSSLDEITDLAGVRIITYLESDVDKIADLIGSEFFVDPRNSVDKRNVESNEFGYRSLHVVASLDRKREKLREYNRFKGLKFEVQIRSILQHAWAEIEHDIGYKGKFTLPKSTKRSFNRLAALLETADVEFDRLKKALGQYAENIDKEIENNPQIVELNKISLKSYLKDDFVTQLELYISQQTESTFESETFMDVEFLIKDLSYFEIDTIEKLDGELKKNYEEISKLVDVFFTLIDRAVGGHHERGISVFFLCYALIIKPENVEMIDNYFKFVWPNDKSTDVKEALLKISSEFYPKQFVINKNTPP